MQKTDLFGKAIYDYYTHNNPQPLWFTYGGFSIQETKKDVTRYFRKPWQFTKLEKLLIKNIRGKTLDIGCATGYYFPAMQRFGDVIGIDVSEPLIAICQSKGLTNCIQQDVFTYEPPSRFDTITLLENDIGVGGTLDSLTKLLQKLKVLLTPNGQVLAIQNNFAQDFLSSTIHIRYKKEEENILWSYSNLYFLKEQCENVGFIFEVLSYGKNNLYLARLTLPQPL